ncbi:hypothetical protein CKO28_00120 [Rhodovibrio sodomensis]|uniref:Methylase n=1 Tax=Rhodovibrio sodomensis TaxID=1088 RepID=A0ABS1D7P4_9PROT|nr:strawberry notch family protein [Rhodovibrio sodomensis]MBK1666444.1 hypothetical protein [Rhodovibrio sodomensis]
MTQQIAGLAELLRQQQALDPQQHGEDVREQAVALMLQRAGAALKPQARSGRSVLDALAKLEELAGLRPESVQRRWLGLRALDLKSGEQIGGNQVSDPIIAAMAAAAGAVVTTQDDDRVSGVVGQMGKRTPDTLAARARIVFPGRGGGFRVEQDDKLLFGEPSRGASAQEILRAIDQVETRHAAGARKNARGAQPITYTQMSQEALIKEREGDQLFNSYRTTLRFNGAQAHPSPLVESTALASVTRPQATYQPILPPEVMTKGLLSDVQLEEVVYAGQAHQEYLASDPMDPGGTPPRQGYLCGAGTGVGKGRVAAGITLDNWCQGRHRAVWVSENRKLLSSASRDWVALGGKHGDLIDLAETPKGAQIPARNGILFLSYALLRERVDQIVEWLGLTSDCPIFFDEAHNGRYASVPGQQGWGSTKKSKQGMAMLELQRQLPNARVTYLSATSSSDIATLGYAPRLGLWGRGTAFAEYDSFVEQMAEGGINAMELVARDMKALGIYSAPNLSFEGITYERLEHVLTAQERQVQDELSRAWSKVNVSLQKAIATVGLNSGQTTVMSKDAGRATRSFLFQQYGMAKSRFFQALLSSFKAQPVIEAARQDLANGHQVILQFTNTYAANAERAIAENTSGDIADVEATPRDILISYIEEHFPVVKHKVVQHGYGKKAKFAVQQVKDANGNPVICPKAEAERDQLIHHIQSLSIPEGPMEQILEAFGTDTVAEVTGRRRRLAPGPDGRRMLEDRTSSAVMEDVRMFQAGHKPVLMFSSSGSAGADYHADKIVGPGALRRHYLVQPGWRADQAIQSLGRSHRSGQAQAPVYILVTTDLWTDRRMLSTVAAGMQKLGAITRGQRHAASQELFSQDDNLESDLASDAWMRFLKDLQAGKVSNLSLASFEHETGIIVRKLGSNQLADETPPLRRFLNAMSGMTCDRQAIFGNAFKATLDEVRLEAISRGSYDRGIEAIEPASLIKLEDTVIYRDPATGAATRLLKMLRVDEAQPTAFKDAQTQAKNGGGSRYVVSQLTGRVALIVFPRMLGQATSDSDQVKLVTPHGTKTRTRGEVVKERWRPLNIHEAEDLWHAELQTVSDEEETIFYVATGCLLPLWDKLPKKKVKVYQMITDEGERILGRTLPESWADRVVARASASSGAGIDPMEALAKLEDEEFVQLANGWVAQGRVDVKTGLTGIEIIVMDEDTNRYKAEMEHAGVIVRKSVLRPGELDFHLPHDRQLREQAWQAITQSRPVVGVTSYKG